ncbi:MAG TPA: DNA polymerase III subunit delta' [Candidatus Baltobacteraceae bacterium]|nr:DNA polymerase III subunit delta' [Candidatus Baltobacteraceae bacterium]
MPLSAIFGQDRAMALLRSAWTGGRLAQAYVFSGPAGVGKRTAALALAQAVNCLSPVSGPAADACGACPACRRIAAGRHPDVMLVGPAEDKTVITIDQVRALSGQAGLRAYEGRTKVWILDPADQMQEAAANALLKTLEEPTGSALFLLICTAVSALLPTIRSRCQEVRFDSLPDAALVAILEAQGRSADNARRSAALAGGSAARALALDVTQEEADREQLVTEVTAALESLPALLDVAERLGKTRAGAAEALATIEAVTRDAAVTQSDAGDLLAIERAALAQRALGPLTIDTLLDMAAAQAEARWRLGVNAQPRFVFEHLLLAMRAAKHKGSS